MKLTAFITGIFLFSSVVYGQPTPKPEAAAEGTKVAKAELINPKGERIGIATLIEGPDGIKVALQAYDLPPGLHGLHFHSVGKCDTPDFKSAGGHFNPYGKSHGIKNPEGPHVGDLPNLLVGPEGAAVMITLAPLATLRPGKNSLFDSDGTALVIHSGTDDQMSDPSGNSGDRIACGVITK